MKYRLVFLILCLLVTTAVIDSVQAPGAHSQGGEPRFAFPGARRFAITSYFDHTHPDSSYSIIDDEIVIYSTERGLRSNNCFDCFQSGSVQVCGYYTVLQNPANCGSAGGRRVYYDMHPAFDYSFPQNTPIVAVAPGAAFRRSSLGSSVYITEFQYYSEYSKSWRRLRPSQCALPGNRPCG